MPSSKPAHVKTAVIAKAAIGASKSQIARDLDITRPTVTRILNESEFSNLVEQGKSNLYQMIPEAVDIYGSRVKKNALEAKDFLERVTVLPSRPSEQTTNNGVQINFHRDPMTPSVALPEKPEL
jgi:DNA-binding transcriptional regulator LsrR (DeoR family)